MFFLGLNFHISVWQGDKSYVTLHRVLASLNLPAALEDLSGDSIPQSIAEKSRSIVQQGGLQSIEQLIKDLPELLTRNREILDEVRQPAHNEI